MKPAYDEVSVESLEALENVVKLCLPDHPCGRDDCLRCRKNVEEAWQNEMERADREALINNIIGGKF